MAKDIMALEFMDVLPNSPLGVCCCGCCFIVNFILIILFFPCTVTQLGQFKYGLLKNKVTGYVNLKESYQPGRYWIGFWKEFVEFPSTLCTIEFSDEKPEEGVQHLSVLRSRDKDGKQIELDISIQYKLEPQNLGAIYKDMLINYEDIFISELRDAFAKAANNFGIQETWEDYTNTVEILRSKCIEVLTQRFAECWGLQLWGVGLTNRYETKLIATQVRKQAQKTEQSRKLQSEVRAKTQVLLAEYRKKITIIEAGGWAQAYEIREAAKARAEANTINGSSIILSMVRDSVCPEQFQTGYEFEEGSGIASTGEECNKSYRMPGKTMIAYQKFVMLDQLQNNSLVYRMGGGMVASSPIDVQASMDIIADAGKRKPTNERRLTLSKHSREHRVPEL